MSSSDDHPISRRAFVQSVAALTAGAALGSHAASVEDGPLQIKSGVAQLFVDDYLIAEQKSLKRTLRQPKKDNDGQAPVIALDDEFGEYSATLEANGTILYDPRLKKYVMFALAFSPSMPGPDRVRLYRFTSNDAMSWIKGDDGTPQRITFDLKDAASGESATNIDLFSCFYDAGDDRYPYKGWLHFANWGKDKEGIYLVRSQDGRTWERGPMLMRSGSRVIRQDGRSLNGPGDVTIFYHDALQNRFLANLRFASSVTVGPENRLRARAFLFLKRMDEPVDLSRVERVDLVPAAARERGDLPHDEYYSSTAWRYESLWLGGLKVWHGGGDYPYSAAGSAFLKLTVSRDGLHWSKVSFANDAGVPEVFLPNGPEGGANGRNDGGYMTEFSQGPLRVGDELVYYYGSSSYGKNKPRNIRVSGGGIFRSHLRPDGFVSVDAGSLTTKLLSCAGEDLFINGVGPIRVEIVGVDGKTRASTTVRGNSLRHRVSFAGNSLRRIASGARLDVTYWRLRFSVHQNGRLYSFTVR